jgi:DNA polymerase-3 subunit alpha
VNSSQVSLFGGSSEVLIAEPEIPPCDPWGSLETLKREKEVVGIYISGHPLDDFKNEMLAFCNAEVQALNDLPSQVNRELSVAGVITDVQHRVSKNGKGWATFVLEDYSDSFEFRIFGEEYLKYRHFLTINAFVFIKVFIREGWTNKDSGQKGDPRLQFNQVLLLQDVMETFAKKLTIQLELGQLHENRIRQLQDTLKAFKGAHPLNFVVYEQEDAIKVNLSSRKQKVQINSELLSTLQKQEVHFKLN